MNTLELAVDVQQAFSALEAHLREQPSTPDAILDEQTYARWRRIYRQRREDLEDALMAAVAARMAVRLQCDDRRRDGVDD
ncbi:hypothetical protein CJ179_39060 [Rhodococcus sp. ACS1]|uniref:hypothetical protein n=1 Tax=Rhodococcus sp. ACS1 TaxID=2028570 RepID=UPI000BB0F59E|nr:hypothetical protein [Rhodococcus sp. ACS1]PBC38592.1 hypothetical protein CJ179_39060 [Rhodococcus sp. ACS1]